MFLKNKILLLFCLVSSIAFISCNQSEMAENITLTIDFVIDEDGLEFDSAIVLNAFDESQVLRDYGDNITHIEIRSIDCHATYFTGPASQQINTGSLEVAGKDGAGAVIAGNITSENLMILSYEHKKLTLQQDGIKRLEKLIKNDPHEFRLRLFGISNLSPNEYTLTLEIELQMIAIPL